MSELGARLRRAREEKSITLEQAEEVTHIRRGLLQAIEEGRYAELPGDVYGRGLIRNYARFLGLDPETSAQEYLQYAARPQRVIPQVLDEPLAPVRRSYAWLIGLLALVVLLVAVWYGYQTLIVDQGRRLESLWPLVISTPAPTPAEPASPAREATAAPGQTPVPTDSVGELSPVGEPTQTPTAGPIALPTPRPIATANPTPIVGVYIEALALADTYVEATADGARIYTGTLRPNETAQWRADQVIALRVGNAGGLQLTVNGYDVGSLGASGQVITVEYTVDSLPGQ
ncbi:MAG: helix-turn-helix domain-containing protein [Anaerolineae bacterium]